MIRATMGLLVLLAPWPAYSGFLGQDLYGSLVFITGQTVAETELSPNPATVTDGPEWMSLGYEIDVMDTMISFSSPTQPDISDADFFGWVFSDLGDTIADIIGVSVDPATTLQGFDVGDRIAFDANSISLNFQGLDATDLVPGATEAFAKFNVRFRSDAPVPGTFALLGLGIAGLWARRRAVVTSDRPSR